MLIEENGQSIDVPIEVLVYCPYSAGVTTHLIYNHLSLDMEETFVIHVKSDRAIVAVGELGALIDLKASFVVRRLDLGQLGFSLE